MEIAATLALLSVAIIVAGVLISRRSNGQDPIALQQMEAVRGQVAQSVDLVTGRMLEMERALNARVLEAQQQMRDSTEQNANQFLSLERTMNDRVLEMQKQVGDGLDRSSVQLSGVRESLAQTNEMVKQVQEVGREMQELQDILRPPKLRGQLGELLLGNLLRQVLPEGSFIEQYEFPQRRVRVDAVIRLSGGLVPVDSKFPMESFQRLLASGSDDDRRRNRSGFVRDVRSHIDAITSKYICPEDGTFDFALMYIPAENVYYEIIAGEDASSEGSLYQYALTRKVVPVSPNSFYAYLQAVALGLKGLRIERNAQHIMGRLSQLEGELNQFGNEFQTVGRHLTNAHARYDEASRSLLRFGERLQSLATPVGDVIGPDRLPGPSDISIIPQ